MKKTFLTLLFTQVALMAPAFADLDPSVQQALTNMRNNVRMLPYGIQNYANQDINIIETALLRQGQSGSPTQPKTVIRCSGYNTALGTYRGFGEDAVDEEVAKNNFLVNCKANPKAYNSNYSSDCDWTRFECKKIPATN